MNDHPMTLARRVMDRELARIVYHVQVPITVRILDYQPGTPTKYVYGPTGGHPGEASHMEAELYDPTGAKADWVREHLDDRDWAQIERECFEQAESENGYQ